MSLYEGTGIDTRLDKSEPDVASWSSGIRLLQSQLQLKKTVLTQQTKREQRKGGSSVLAPVVDLKSRKEEQEDMSSPFPFIQPNRNSKSGGGTGIQDPDWHCKDCYDPMWPNEYDKIIKERRERDQEKCRNDRDRNRDDRKRRGPRFNGGESPPPKFSGFGGRPDEADEYDKSPPKPPSGSASRYGGAAIAPPPSLQESVPIIPVNNEIKLPTSVIVPYGSSSVAAKIMAKYGFKDGQGLGKQEQGMSVALQVEKTSKRGGRIIHENDFVAPGTSDSPPPSAAQVDSPQPNSEPSITEIMKAPSKVVLLRNMVGPGDVDSELEPEVKDECNTKYGEVASVVINEVPNVVAEEAVRIFVEFKRIESAIKAVVDLNGRFFGGRQVRAGFFGFDKYKSRQLND